MHKRIRAEGTTDYFMKIIFPDMKFECKQCGKCCLLQPADLNDAEYQKILAKGFTDFLDETSKEYKQIKRKKDNSCLFLTEEKKCSIYDVRPATCRLQPFLIIDYNIFNDTIKLGITSYCSYRFDKSKVIEAIISFGVGGGIALIVLSAWHDNEG
jgi:Fe-S-cluster containining protein